MSAVVMEFSPIEKRANCWGWFLTATGWPSRFIAYGNVRTKREAAARREADIADHRKAGFTVVVDGSVNTALVGQVQ